MRFECESVRDYLYYYFFNPCQQLLVVGVKLYANLLWDIVINCSFWGM
jgi:hypothetical protein